MCFSKAKKKKKQKENGSAEHLWHASYKSHVFGRGSDVWLSVAGEKLHFGERKEKKSEEKKNINGGVIYVAGSNHTKKERLPIIPYMETYMRLEWG